MLMPVFPLVSDLLMGGFGGSVIHKPEDVLAMMLMPVFPLLSDLPVGGFGMG